MNYETANFTRNRAPESAEKPKKLKNACAKNREECSDVNQPKLRHYRKKGVTKGMSGPASIYAIAEMNRRAEEYSLKVRSELFRIGCSPKQISVIRQGAYLQMKHQQQIIIAPPQGILSVLQKISPGEDCKTVWEQIRQHSHLLDGKSRRAGFSIAVVISLLILLIFLLVFQKL